MNPHAEVGELSSILSTCENRVRWLNTLKLKLTAIHQLQYLTLPGKGHDKREAAYQKPNTVPICTFQKLPSKGLNSTQSQISLKVNKTPSLWPTVMNDFVIYYL